MRSRLEEICGSGSSRAPHADAAIAGKRGFSCAALGSFPLPKLLSGPAVGGRPCSRGAQRHEVTAGIVAVLGQEGIGCHKQTTQMSREEVGR